MHKHVAICVITHRRPDGLRKLLASLAGLCFERMAAPAITVVVVDNDAKGSAEPVVCEFASHYPWALDYEQELEKGIPFARNHCLDSALRLGADAIAFIDDDEYCEPSWLEELLLQKQQSEADVVWGPVMPVFAQAIPSWMEEGRFFARQHYANGTVTDAAATNNVLFSSYMVSDGTLRFNVAMRYTGGTDHVFFSQAAQRGYSIVWAENAQVWEDIPAERATESWLCRRYLRQGNTHSLTEMQLDDSLSTKVKLFAQGVLRVMLGAVSYPATFFTSKVQGMKIKKALYRGMGMLSALFQVTYQEYKT
jgi:glycosyltransferase involved in cell wall biosynthesis